MTPLLTFVISVLYYCLDYTLACENVEIVKREAWGARTSLENDTMVMPVKHIFIHHTAGLTCHDKASCSSVMRGIQNYHMDDLKWDDIGYNFLIGGDGRVYEGRSWTRVGAHTYGFNRISIAFCLMGNYVNEIPNNDMLQATKRMISCAHEKDYASDDAKIHGHRDGTCTECPGEMLYDVIKNWPDFEKGPLLGYNCNG